MIDAIEVARDALANGGAVPEPAARALLELAEESDYWRRVAFFLAQSQAMNTLAAARSRRVGRTALTRQAETSRSAYNALRYGSAVPAVPEAATKELLEEARIVAEDALKDRT